MPILYMHWMNNNHNNFQVSINDRLLVSINILLFCTLIKLQKKLLIQSISLLVFGPSSITAGFRRFGTGENSTATGHPHQ